MKRTASIGIVIVIVVIAVGVAAYFLMAAPAQGKIKVALAFSGLIGDPGFPSGGYKALVVARDKYGAEIAYHEHTEYADIERVLSDYASSGFTLVWGHGGEYKDATPKVADRFPKTLFMTTATMTARPNLRVYNIIYAQGGYMVGMVAGLTTKTNKIGVVIGAEYPPILSIVNSIKDGAKSVNPAATVFVSNVESWVDAPKGKEFALAQIEAGADVVFSYADLSGEGVIQAATEKNVKYIGETVDHYERTPTNIRLGYFTFQFIPQIEDVMPLIKSGKFEGKIVDLGIDKGSVDFVTDANISASATSQVNTMRAKILDGTFQVPLNFTKTW